VVFRLVVHPGQAVQVGLGLGGHAHGRHVGVEHGGGVVGYVVEDLVGPHHVPGDDPAVALAVVPGAHEVVVLEEHVEELGGVAAGVDVGDVGAQASVGDDAPPGFHAAAFQEFGVDDEAQAGAQHVALDTAAAGGHHAGDGAV